MLDKSCYQFESMQMRYTINRLVNQETHLRYFRLHSLLTNLALQHGEKLSATRLASLPVIATARKPSAVKAAASAALSLARPAALIYRKLVLLRLSGGRLTRGPTFQALFLWFQRHLNWNRMISTSFPDRFL
jgi:hypothetical protein